MLVVKARLGSGIITGDRQEDKFHKLAYVELTAFLQSFVDPYFISQIGHYHGCRSISYQAISGQSSSQWYASLRWVGILDLLFPFMNKACHGYWLCIWMPLGAIWFLSGMDPGILC